MRAQFAPFDAKSPSHKLTTISHRQILMNG
jgi:hypothetical protein